MALNSSSEIASVDPNEVARYAALADTWWDQTDPFWPLHRLNELRVAYITDMLCRLFRSAHDVEQLLRGLRMLDIGSGGSILSEEMTACGATAHDIDVVTRNIPVARLHAANGALNIL